MGIRTPDLLHAMQALYQLSYSPSRADLPGSSATPVYKNRLLHVAGIPGAFRVWLQVRKDTDIVMQKAPAVTSPRQHRPVTVTKRPEYPRLPRDLEQPRDGHAERRAVGHHDGR
jgi:hypothetical protein